MNCKPFDPEGKLEAVLRAHMARYPAGEIADWVKLVFQSEFAGGHMIADPAASLSFLLTEWERVSPDPAGVLFEEVGDGLTRLYLPAAKAMGLSPRAVNAAFVQTAGANRGTVPRFEHKLSLLGRLANEKAAPLSWEPLNAYLAQYRRMGYPPVHHSAAYAAAYRPHYRVIDPAFWSGD